MPKALINGVNLYYEVTGEGFPLVWSHEFAGAYESWEPQVRFFSRRYQVVTYNARGYPPSDVPEAPEAYSQDQSVDDLRGLMLHLGLGQAYVGGLSMGGGVALNFGLKYPEMAKGLIVASAGSGSVEPEVFRRDGMAMAGRLEQEGMETVGEVYAMGPTRVQLRRKDPRGWEEFRRQLTGHSGVGSARTLRGVQLERPTVFALEDKMRALEVPTLIMIGDEDEPCIEPSVFMKRCIPRSGLAVFPQCGHAINLEEPALFNQAVLDFFTAIESDRWARRDEVPEAGAVLPRW